MSDSSKLVADLRTSLNHLGHPPLLSIPQRTGEDGISQRKFKIVPGIVKLTFFGTWHIMYFMLNENLTIENQQVTNWNFNICMRTFDRGATYNRSTPWATARRWLKKSADNRRHTTWETSLGMTERMGKASRRHCSRWLNCEGPP